MLNTAILLAQSNNSGSLVGIIFLLVYLAIIVFVIASVWIVFDKAGQPGWAAIIPIFNFIILLRVAGKPIWWIILMFIPLVNIVVGILVPISVAKNFSRGVGFGVGLIFLPFVFYPILAFGSAQYAPIE